MQSFGRSFTVLTSVDSTNNYAMQMVHARLAKHGDTWFAMNQTRGKGQRGKQWASGNGENIIMSIVLTPTFLIPMQSFLLNAAIALGTYDFFKKYAGCTVRIKWPNDIYWGDRKAGGILIETVIQSQNWLYAIVGIGININQQQFEESLARPVSLRQITGKYFEVTDLARELCYFLETRYEALKAGNENLILQDYRQAMYKLNEMVRFRRHNKDEEVRVTGVSHDGLLLVETSAGETAQWMWGTVEWLL